MGRPVGAVTALARAVLLLLVPGAGLGQEAPGPGDRHADRPSIRAVRSDASIDLDGRLEEAAWAAAPRATSFTQLDPEEGRPASQPTEVRVLYDDAALYVGARLSDTTGVSTRLGRRDAFLPDSDTFTISLDSRHDHRTAYTFTVNPSGVREDEFANDESWDPVWEVATEVDDGGWSLEMRIPFSQLRFGSAGEQTWGFQAIRRIADRQESAYFAFTPKAERAGVAEYGHLVGLEGIRPGRHVEVLPYVVARSEFVGVADGDPFRDRPEWDVTAGADVKYGLTSALTLDATINPDFGQVELDPAVVNLTAFETFFSEKRPFFIEGTDVFDFEGTRLFHSRRIGRAPRGSLPAEVVHVDMPDETTILGAAKVSGKTADGWSIGVLEAVTAEEEARFETADGERGSVAVEPFTNYFVGRLRRDLRAGRTVLGGMATAVHRNLDAAGLAERLRSSAYAGGFDFGHEFADRTWEVEGFVSGSHVRGRPEVILAAQRSSARYYQRPDAGHVEIDSTATALSGYAAQVELSRIAGLHWRGRVSAEATSPGYEINDLGFQTSADRAELNGSLSYRETRPGTVFRSWSLDGFTGSDWNFDGDRIGAFVRVGFRAEFLNYWSVSLGGSRGFEALDDRLTRGGPLARRPAGWSVNGFFSSDFRRPVTLDGFASYRENEAGDRSGGVSVGIGVRVGDRLSASVGPGWSWSRSIAQYVATIADPTAERTFGRRYVFADLESRSLDLGARLAWVFTPDLTLEVFAQPFVSSNDFGALKELGAPRTYDFVVYGKDAGTVEPTADGGSRVDPDAAGPAEPFTVGDRDFTLRSLRGNAVLRWQWRPGSTLFLVWQQVRSDFAPVADFDLGGFLGPKPDNIFVLKVNYWLNP